MIITKDKHKTIFNIGAFIAIILFANIMLSLSYQQSVYLNEPALAVFILLLLTGFNAFVLISYYRTWLKAQKRGDKPETPTTIV